MPYRVRIYFYIDQQCVELYSQAIFEQALDFYSSRFIRTDAQINATKWFKTYATHHTINKKRIEYL